VDDPLYVPPWVRRFVSSTTFVSGALVGIIVFDVFYVKPKLEKKQDANRQLVDMVKTSEKRVAYLAVLMGEHNVELEEFDLIALNRLS